MGVVAIPERLYLNDFVCGIEIAFLLWKKKRVFIEKKVETNFVSYGSREGSLFGSATAGDQRDDDDNQGPS